ncbi:MAG: 2Fe-2S iron-sulfur cluster-binding protein [bacterium]|nr:2Fe-2S iron-sulfur cluster-binding protein [bacterium]
MPADRIAFFFENRRLEGTDGESIAGALFRVGIRTLSHSVKFHRPRGLHCARGRCVMCHMEVDGTPGVPTCVTPLKDGMRIRREGAIPFFAPLLIASVRMLPFPAGFYYHMFTRPAVVRRFFFGVLRRMAGVGKVRLDAPETKPCDIADSPVASLKRHYGVAVIGAGLSGMAAASAAAEGRADVLLVDEYDRLGGHSIGTTSDAERSDARDTLATGISANPSVTVCAGTTALGFYPPDTILLGPRTRPGQSMPMRRIKADRFIFATGAYDLVPLFENNDTPGVFGERAIRLLLERDGIRPGGRAVVYGMGSRVTDLVQLLASHDIQVAALVDPSNDVPSAEATRVSGRVVRVTGGEWIRSVDVKSANGTKRIPCDLLCTAFPGQGAYELAYQAGFRFEFPETDTDEEKVMRPTTRELHLDKAISCIVVGDLAGDEMWRDRILRGEEAGRIAVNPPRASREG